jgi:hypothetical protein
MPAGVISLFPACYLQWVLQLTRAGRIETLTILPARCRCRHIELPVERLLPAKRTAAAAFDAVLRATVQLAPTDFLVMEVAPLPAGHRDHSKRIAR